MSDRPRRAIPSHEPRVNTLIAKSRREHALQNRLQRHESTVASLFSPLALGHQLRVYPRSRVAGPLPPRSWAYPATTSTASGSLSLNVVPQPQWRARALRWILMHLSEPGLIPHAVLQPDEEERDGPGKPEIPTLREMCVRRLASAALGSIADDSRSAISGSLFDPDLPAHIRRFIVRWAAIHSPLPWPSLEALWGIMYGEQGADGELILVGKDAGGSKINGSKIRDILAPPELELSPQNEDDAEETAWDEEEYTSPPLTILISIAHPLSKHLSLFPPTITHLALIAVPLDSDTTPRILMAKLSGNLRLLEAADLSCNSWLTKGVVETVDWSRRWLRLRSIAFINCPNLRDPESVSNTINNTRNWERAIHIDFA